MITISLCMIVKNEEAVLARCLDSLKPLMDEIIIVDTGSTDRTKELAARYTDKIYDFTWQDDFAAARNFAFSKASMEYIYTADADEMLDEENQHRFALLKEAMLSEIEIVQMHYLTQSSFNTVMNSSNEYRPKLYRRLRSFTWIDPIHETVRLDPLVFDSEIEVLHLPQSLHSKRDYKGFLYAYERDGLLSDKLHSMYAKELSISGTDEDYIAAIPVFSHTIASDTAETRRKEAACILAHTYRIQNLYNEFFKLTLKDMVTTPCAEICCELGQYFYDACDYEEAALWYYNAAFETPSILNVHTNGDLPLNGLADCYEKQGLMEQADKYRQQAENYQLPADS